MIVRTGPHPGFITVHPTFPSDPGPLTLLIIARWLFVKDWRRLPYYSPAPLWERDAVRCLIIDE